MTDQPFCGWCRKDRFEVALFFQGTTGAYICDECAELFAEVARRKKEGLPSRDAPRGMPPELGEVSNGPLIAGGCQLRTSPRSSPILWFNWGHPLLPAYVESAASRAAVVKDGALPRHRRLVLDGRELALFRISRNYPT
jgi:ClpX C4-type zinc finger